MTSYGGNVSAENRCAATPPGAAGRNNAVGPRQLTIFALLAPVPLPGGGVGVSIPAVGHFGGIEAESASGLGEPVLAAATTGAPAPAASTLPQNR
jgi:hypothetical protein